MHHPPQKEGHEGNPVEGNPVKKSKEGNPLRVRPSLSSSPPEVIPIPSDLDTPTFREAWTDWISYRRERRLSAYKSSSLKGLFTAFSEWGNDAAVASIRDSIRNGWQGLFPPKNDVRGVASRERHKPIDYVNDRSWESPPQHEPKTNTRQGGGTRSNQPAPIDHLHGAGWSEPYQHHGAN